VLAVHMHTEVLAGRSKTRRWMSAGASGDRVLASTIIIIIIIQHLYSAIVSYAGCRGTCGAS